MPTTLYLRALTTEVRPACAPQHATTAMVDNTPSTVRALSIAAGSSYIGTGVASQAGPVTAPGVVDSIIIGCPMLWMSPPLTAAVTISGTVNADLWGMQGNNNANAAIGCVVWRIAPNGTESVVISLANTSELTTSTTQKTMSGTPTSTAFSPGDCIGVAVYFDDAASVTMASGYTLTAHYDGPEAASGDTQVRFAETLSFASAPTGTTTNLLADASDLSGTGRRKMWTDAVSGATTYTVSTVASPAAAQWTNTAGGTALEWFTPSLAAVDVQGRFSLTFRGSESNAAANVSPMALVYRTASDGSSPVQVGQGRLNGELGTTTANTTIYGHVNTSLSEGERLMVRLYTASSDTAQASSYTCSVVVEDSIAVAVQWPVVLTLSSGGGPTGRPKVWTDGAWAQKPGKVWNGSAWVEKPWKVWDGSQWKTVK